MKERKLNAERKKPVSVKRNSFESGSKRRDWLGRKKSEGKLNVRRLWKGREVSGGVCLGPPTQARAV